MSDPAAETHSRPGLLGPIRLDHVWAAIPLVFVFYYACSLPIVHSDFFYNLMNGRLMVEQGALLDRDVLAYAPLRETFYNQPWLTQLAYFAEMRLGGYPLVLFVHACAVTAAFALVFAVARQLSGSVRWAAAATLLSFLVAALNLSVRPQAYSFLPFALILLLLWRYADRGRPLFLVPAVMAIWVNVHGAFLLGFGLVALFLGAAVLEAMWPWRGTGAIWRSPRVRRLALLLGLTALSMLLNPYGPGIVAYWILATSDPIARSLNLEWRPTALEGPIGVLFFLSWLPIVALLAISRQRLRWTEALLLLAFALFALVSIRNVVWWALVMPPILVGYAARTWPSAKSMNQARREKPALNAVLLGILGIVALLGLPWLRANNPLLAPPLRTYLDAKHPTQAVEFLRREGIQGKLFSRMEWGGYLEWELWPRLQPLVDARIEIRPPQVWLDYFAILDGSARWQALLDRYQVDYVILEYQAYPRLEREISTSAAWREIHRDSLAVVYARR